MSDKLLTLSELAEYLGLREERVIDLVDKKIITAYQLGGELLRFRKEQIDAIRSEIDSRVNEMGEMTAGDIQRVRKEKLKISSKSAGGNDPREAISDFLYFNDFYIFSGILVVILLIVIFKG
ncbi:MAG: helix-turn-helix domain-containing protein [Candidatus Aadella gelida]|nr:helix-turn-helix domain-containing protein [Candidatus Aadella gelida]